MSKFEQVLQDWATDELADLEVIEHLDFEPELRCELSECPNVADFVIRCLHCNDAGLMCGLHRLKGMALFEAGREILCGQCLTVSRFPVLMVEFIPIGGRS